MKDVWNEIVLLKLFYICCRLDTTINEMDFSPVKTSRRLDRSNHSLLSADNSIPEESEEEEENEEDEEVGDNEEKIGESAGKAASHVTHRAPCSAPGNWPGSSAGSSRGSR